MKKQLITFILGLCLLPAAKAQDVIYALPSTTLTVEVEVEQEDFFAGPYATYARKFLNMDVKDRNAVRSSVTALELIPRVEADLKALYSCESDNAALLALTAQGLVALQNKADAGALAWRFLPPSAPPSPAASPVPSRRKPASPTRASGRKTPWCRFPLSTR